MLDLETHGHRAEPEKDFFFSRACELFRHNGGGNVSFTSLQEKGLLLPFLHFYKGNLGVLANDLAEDDMRNYRNGKEEIESKIIAALLHSNGNFDDVVAKSRRNGLWNKVTYTYPDGWAGLEGKLCRFNVSFAQTAANELASGQALSPIEQAIVALTLLYRVQAMNLNMYDQRYLKKVLATLPNDIPDEATYSSFITKVMVFQHYTKQQRWDFFYDLDALDDVGRQLLYMCFAATPKGQTVSDLFIEE